MPEANRPMRASSLALLPLLLLLGACTGGSGPGDGAPSGSPAPSPDAPPQSVPGYTPPPVTVTPVTATPTPPPGTPTPTPPPTLAPAASLPPAAEDSLRAYLAGRGLTLAGACLAITADPGETAHCYLVLEGSTLERMRLVVGRWASGQGVAVTLMCGPAGTCRVTEVAAPAGSP